MAVCGSRYGTLSAKERNALPASAFGLPSTRQYPMPDSSHAKNAKARARQEVKRAYDATAAIARKTLAKIERLSSLVAELAPKKAPPKKAPPKKAPPKKAAPKKAAPKKAAPKKAAPKKAAKKRTRVEECASMLGKRGAAKRKANRARKTETERKRILNEALAAAVVMS